MSLCVSLSVARVGTPVDRSTDYSSASIIRSTRPFPFPHTLPTHSPIKSAVSTHGVDTTFRGNGNPGRPRLNDRFDRSTTRPRDRRCDRAIDVTTAHKFIRAIIHRAVVVEPRVTRERTHMPRPPLHRATRPSLHPCIHRARGCVRTGGGDHDDVSKSLKNKSMDAFVRDSTRTEKRVVGARGVSRRARV